MKRKPRTPKRRAAAAAWLTLAASTPAGADWPPWMERWLFNPVERTERGLERFAAGAAHDAAPPLETALRLAGDQPVAMYNAGTARLASGRGDARPLLAAAAAGARPDLAARASYNLGNARMAGRDLQGAIEAFEQALRREPGLEDAKFNLELARRRLEEEEQQQEEQQHQEQQPQPPQEQPPQEQPPKQPQQQEQQPQSEEQRPRPEPPQQDPSQPPPPRQEESPLPQFRDLPDMTAEEAAAILEAVENMEREQRRQEAANAARKNPRGGKDW